MESAIRFGREQQLVGVVDRPDDCAKDLAVVIPNAGIVHHVGPFRLHVILARALSAIGVTTFRMDLSGVGESDAVAGGGKLLERNCRDIQDGMDYLQRRFGIARFVIAGLCSGADDAHTVAYTDPRVVGVVALDGYAYPNLRFRLINILPRVVNPVRVFRFALRILGRVFGSESEESFKDAAYFREFPDRQEFANQIEANAKRGVSYLLIYSGGVNYYNHQKQAYHFITNGTPPDQISVKYFADCDHTYYLKADRQKVVDTIADWVSSEVKTSLPPLNAFNPGNPGTPVSTG